MKQTLEALINGDDQIINYYINARNHWEQIFEQVEPTTIPVMAERLFREQIWFEQNCGGRWFGQEIMVLSAIAYFYNSQEGFGENLDRAKSILLAFAESMCSIEVKQIAEDIPKTYFELES